MWVWRQPIEAIPWGRPPTHLILDRDRVSGGDLTPRATTIGVETPPTPFRTSKANAFAERAGRARRNRCLDDVLIVNEQHLRAELAEYVAEYNVERRPPRPGAEATAPRLPLSPAHWHGEIAAGVGRAPHSYLRRFGEHAPLIGPGGNQVVVPARMTPIPVTGCFAGGAPAAPLYLPIYSTDPARRQLAGSDAISPGWAMLVCAARRQ